MTCEERETLEQTFTKISIKTTVKRKYFALKSVYNMEAAMICRSFTQII